MEENIIYIFKLFNLFIMDNRHIPESRQGGTVDPCTQHQLNSHQLPNLVPSIPSPASPFSLLFK